MSKVAEFFAKIGIQIEGLDSLTALGNSIKAISADTDGLVKNLEKMQKAIAKTPATASVEKLKATKATAPTPVPDIKTSKRVLENAEIERVKRQRIKLAAEASKSVVEEESRWGIKTINAKKRATLEVSIQKEVNRQRAEEDKRALEEQKRQGKVENAIIGNELKRQLMDKQKANNIEVLNHKEMIRLKAEERRREERAKAAAAKKDAMDAAATVHNLGTLQGYIDNYTKSLRQALAASNQLNIGLKNTSIVTGLSKGQIQDAYRVADLTNTSRDAMVEALDAIGQYNAKLRSGQIDAKAAGAYNFLGIDPTRGSSTDVSEQLRKRMANASEDQKRIIRLKIEEAGLGTEYYKALEEMNRRGMSFKDTKGQNILADQASALDKFNEATTKLSVSWETFKTRVMASVGEALTPLLEALTGVVDIVNSFLSAIGPEARKGMGFLVMMQAMMLSLASFTISILKAGKLIMWLKGLGTAGSVASTVATTATTAATTTTTTATGAGAGGAAVGGGAAAGGVAAGVGGGLMAAGPLLGIYAGYKTADPYADKATPGIMKLWEKNPWAVAAASPVLAAYIKYLEVTTPDSNQLVQQRGGGTTMVTNTQATININGAGNPEAVAKAAVAELNKTRERSMGQQWNSTAYTNR